MSERNDILRSGLRATTGLLITAVAATAVVLISTVPLPERVHEPIELGVNTAQGETRQLICGGSFSELGADASRSGVAIPTGRASIGIAGDAEESGELAREEEGGSLPVVLEGESGDPMAAAQVQMVETSMFRGLTASACAEPLNEQWLVGGDTKVGTFTTLNVGNAGDVPATVQITVYDEEGLVDSVQTTGVLVPAGSERTVSLNGYSPDSERIAVNVLSTGAPVTANLGVSQVVDITPIAADTVTRQSSAATSLNIPGITNVNNIDHTHAEDGGDDFPVVVRALTAEETPGTATVSALTPDGHATQLGEIELTPRAVGELVVDRWPAKANAVRIDADVPIVGGALGSAAEDDTHDYAWFAPAPTLPADTPIAAPVIAGGSLVLANPSDAPVTVEISARVEDDAEDADADAEPAEPIELPPGSATVVDAPADAILTSSGPIVAGVRAIDNGEIAGYPILPVADRIGELTVYPR